MYRGYMDIAEIKSQAAKFPLDQLHTLISSVSEERDPYWKEKTRAIVETLEQHSQLEIVGKTVSTAQALELIAHHSQWENVQRGKLSAFLVGMPNATFLEMLARSDPSQLDVLKKEGLTESLQHHLMGLYHAAWAKSKELDPNIITLEQEIVALNPLEMGWKEKRAIENKLEELSFEYRQVLVPIDKALSIAWNAALPDLVEKLSEAKEHYQRILSRLIGSPYKNLSFPAMGLYALLEKQLFSVYGNPQNPSDTDALNDEDPAIEGLTKLSIWYPEDYFALGLIPAVEITDKDQVVSKAAESLTLLGLRTVKDLKRAAIYSKQSLEEWLAKHRSEGYFTTEARGR